MRGASWVGLGHVVSQLCWFSSLLVLAAYVAPEAFGGVALAMVGLQVAWLVVGAGTRGSFVVTPVLGRAQVRRALIRNVGLGLLVAVGVALLPRGAVDTLAPGADPLVLRVLFASVVLYALAVVPLALLQKAMRFKQHALVHAMSAALASAGSVVAVVLGAGVWALVARQVAFQALLALLAWRWSRDLVPRPGTVGSPVRRGVAEGFAALALISFLALNVDSVVIAHIGDIEGVGLYALAFTIAFAPMTQVAWQVGKVLFPAAAHSEPVAVAGRGLKAVRLAGLLMWPAAPLAVLLVPVVVPAVLGQDWRGMVVPLQVLVVAGSVHAVIAILREFLLGRGVIGVSVRIEAVWLAGTTLALVPAVAWAGIEGAAVVHVASVVPLALAYARWGLPPLGLTAADVGRALRPAALVVMAEALGGAAMLVASRWVGLPDDAAWSLAALTAAAGAAAVLGTVARPVLLEGRAALRSARVPAGAR